MAIENGEKRTDSFSRERSRASRAHPASARFVPCHMKNYLQSWRGRRSAPQTKVITEVLKSRMADGWTSEPLPGRLSLNSDQSQRGGMQKGQTLPRQVSREPLLDRWIAVAH